MYNMNVYIYMLIAAHDGQKIYTKTPNWVTNPKKKKHVTSFVLFYSYFPSTFLYWGKCQPH